VAIIDISGEYVIEDQKLLETFKALLDFAEIEYRVEMYQKTDIPPSVTYSHHGSHGWPSKAVTKIII